VVVVAAHLMCVKVATRSRTVWLWLVVAAVVVVVPLPLVRVVLVAARPVRLGAMDLKRQVVVVVLNQQVGRVERVMQVLMAPMAHLAPEEPVV
jgi:hypothetical protein